MRINRFHTYLPPAFFSNIDLTILFDFEGEPSQQLCSIVMSEIAEKDPLFQILTREQIYRNVSGNELSWRFYLSRDELVNKVELAMHTAGAYRERIERYQKIEPPEEFFTRGSRLYKKRKLRFIYCIAQALEEGRIYSASDVEAVVQNERRFMKPVDSVDASHARVALIELQLMERTSDGWFYWRTPAPEKIDGLVFPSRLEGLEKRGYLFYENPELGFSVSYFGKNPEASATVYRYGSDETSINAESIEREFLLAKEEIFQTYRHTDRVAVILEEKRLTMDNEAGREETVCHLTLSVQDSDEKRFRSHLVVTSWRGRFMKVRFSAPDSVENEEEVLLRFTRSLLKRLARQDTV